MNCYAKTTTVQATIHEAIHDESKELKLKVGLLREN
jgi:hypothetical protein